MNPALEKLFNSILEGDASGTLTNLQVVLEEKLDLMTILNEGMIAAMHEVGRRFESGEFYVPEMLIAARAMQNGMNALKPLLQKIEMPAVGKIVFGTVKGDLHDIGKNLVILMLESDGFQIVDLGVDVPHADFVKAIKEHQPDILAMSALLTTTMPGMKAVIEALTAAGLRDKVKIMVGGAPVTEDYARSICADGYAPDASRVVKLAKALIDRQ
ncbi:MAG: cobalamin-binding protein [Anaerolineaceae bacterium]|nr:MAG: cobalamin-binding protein [Anaerolineaceae bacterium]